MKKLIESYIRWLKKTAAENVGISKTGSPVTSLAEDIEIGKIGQEQFKIAQDLELILRLDMILPSKGREDAQVD